MKFSHFLATTGMVFGPLMGASTAQAAPAYSGPPVSYQQVFENPDDNDLRLSYAKQQAAGGDLISAASALEGMLYSQPDWDAARLFYGIVLYELDDRQGAEREFSLLRGRNLTMAQQAQLDQYSGKTKTRNDGPQISGRLEAGLRLDDNAGNALIDTSIALTDQSDLSVFAAGMLTAETPLGQTGLSLFAGARGQTRRHQDFSNADFDTLGGTAGIKGKVQNIKWSAAIDADNVYLSGEKYLTQAGLKLGASMPLSDTLTAHLGAASYQQDFEELSFSFGERFRTGNKSVASIGLVTDQDDLIAGIHAGYENKNATTDALAYSGFSGRVHVRQGFENGVYVKARAKYRTLSYDAPDLFTTSGTVRDDDIFTGQAAVGISLNKAAAGLGMTPSTFLQNKFIETGVNLTSRSSNIPIYEHDNFGGQMKLIWEF